MEKVFEESALLLSLYQRHCLGGSKITLCFH